ncbi:MAG TPA: shikimate kinase [Armatimonadota bacterium]|nr:shikimate kinase [Armatimonadota bacterium]
MNHLLLIGFKGCGKSTVGRLVARRLGRRFIDLDTVIERLFHERGLQRMGFRDVFCQVGEAEFRRLEREAARIVARWAREAPAPMVIALGGGSLVDDETRSLLLPLGRFVYLRVPRNEAVERALSADTPAFLPGRNPVEELSEVYSLREPIYRACAHITVDIGGLGRRAAADRVVGEFDRLATSGGA